MIIQIVGALIRDPDGRLLTVRKAGTHSFMLPGGKIEPGESEVAALARELSEELGVTLVSATPFGRFEAPAANEAGARVRSSVYGVHVEGDMAPAAEIAELLWIDPEAPPDVRLAPLLEKEVLPRLLPSGAGTGSS